MMRRELESAAQRTEIAFRSGRQGQRQRPPLQEPLRWLLADPRRLRTTGIYDAVWVRLLDIPACLQGRQYFEDGSLTMLVRDTFYPANAGVYSLEVGPGGVCCSRTGRDPDLVLDVAQLGSVYLGGVSFTELAHGSLAMSSP